MKKRGLSALSENRDGRGAKEETKIAGIMQGKRCPRYALPVGIRCICVYRN